MIKNKIIAAFWFYLNWIGNLILMRLSQVFWGQGKWHLFHVNGESKVNFWWKQKNKDNNGDREHKKKNFRWGGGGGGGQGNTPLDFGEHGDVYPHHFGRASRMYRLLNTSKHSEYSIDAPRGSMLPWSLKIMHWSPKIPQFPESIFPLLPFAPQILKINSASPQIPKNIS